MTGWILNSMITVLSLQGRIQKSAKGVQNSPRLGHGSPQWGPGVQGPVGSRGRAPVGVWGLRPQKLETY